VVVSRVGGLRSLVNDGVTGLFIEHTDDPAELASRLATLASDPALCKRLGEQGLEEARRKYTWEAVNQRLESIYRMAEQHARGRRQGAP
jgi:glycosyltransferase involved in cell wall biosynthesis